jgi:hypothetical protein
LLVSLVIRERSAKTVAWAPTEHYSAVRERLLRSKPDVWAAIEGCRDLVASCPLHRQGQIPETAIGYAAMVMKRYFSKRTRFQA